MTYEKKRFEILQEHMDQKFDIIAEGHKVLRKDIAGVREEARELNQITNKKLDLIATNLSNQIAGNREEIGKNREAIDKNRKRIDAHDQKLDRFIEKTEVHDQRIERLELV